MSAVTGEPPDEPPHDILAAEGFSVGAGDPFLRHDPVAVPDAPFTEGDPVHDVLAAEEFAMPAGHGGAPVTDGVDAGDGDGFLGSARSRLALVGGALGVGVAVLLRRRR
jgi:hypothetical protein